MKYAVIGLGAVGSIIGGLLAKSGLNVVLIGKKSQVEIINKKGIKIDGINGSIIVENVIASSDLASLDDIDVIIICVKSNDTQNLANSLKDHIKKSASIVSLQNGIRNSTILEKTTGNRVVSGVILFNALYSKPGEVSLTIKGGLVLEADESYMEFIRPITNSFNKTGLNSKTVNHIQGCQWNKLIVNLQNAVTALTGQTIKESIVNNDSRAILIATMKEGINVLKQSGISLKTLPDIDPKKMVRRLSLFNSALIRIGSRFMGLKENARTSMWQSLSRGKPTEIDYINGEIVNLAKKNNLKAPINLKLVELVKKAEKERIKNSFEPNKLRTILGLSK